MKKFFLNFLHYLAVPFVGLAFLYAIHGVKKKAKKYRRDKTLIQQGERYKVVYKACKKLLFLKHIKVDNEGFDRLPNKPVLFIPNHKSGLDPIVLIKVLYETKSLACFSFLAKQELKGSKFVKAAMDLIDTIYIDRDNLRQQYEAFELERQNFLDGRSLILFIEGHRYYGSDFGEFKSTALKIAYTVTAPIVPVTIYGTSGLLDSDKSNVDKNKHIYLSALEMIKPHDYITVKEEFIAEQMKTRMQNKYNNIMSSVQNKRTVFHEA
jgi:1-acyl-sn-glycerol-3-phosphate acyltransferase